MKLYTELADWWPLLDHPASYADEAHGCLALLREAVVGPLRSVLELGSGGGNNASHLKAEVALTLVEPSEAMRRVSAALNPECEHLPGDMRTVRLGRLFDGVFVHDAVVYTTTEADLRAALETVAVHLRPGGAVVVAPDATAETFQPGTSHGGEDELDAAGPGRALRYLEWTLPPAPGTTTFTVHYAFLLRDPDGSVRVVHDTHVEGLFPRATWLRLFAEVGLTARLVTRRIDGVGYDTFVAVKPANEG